MGSFNTNFRSPDDLNPRDREHFEVAKSLPGTFNSAQFRQQYLTLYPRRRPGSIIPSDYCFNKENKGNQGYPRFLLWKGGHDYAFVGLDFQQAGEETSGDPSWSAPWSREEVDVVIGAYFLILENELRGKTNVKAKVLSSLLHGPLANRSEGFIERKMQEISAVLYDQGLPWIEDYKTLPEYQEGYFSEQVRQAADEKKIQELDHASRPTANPEELDQRTRMLQRRRKVNRPAGNQKPRKVRVEESTRHERDPQVRAWVLEEAKGMCECCEAPAPFACDDGRPYLEVHHVITLAEDGPDTVDNAVALCPNCHCQLHHGRDRATVRAKLYQKISRLRKYES